MIDPVSNQLANLSNLGQPGAAPGAGIPAKLPDGIRPADGVSTPGSISSPGGIGAAPAGQFADVLGGLVEAVEEKSQVSQIEARRLMTGESDNIHRSMIAMQESGLAFSLLVEVRNKLVESYQELMRMPV